MNTDHQATIFEFIKRKINGEDSLGNVLGEVLSISSDAVYRRYRGETLLTIYELEKIARHFSISLDALFQLKNNKVLFHFTPLENYDFSMESYLRPILDGLHVLKQQKNPQLAISVNNTHLLQLLNFPHLIRFKLFFWAKTHLQIPEFNDKKFESEKIPEQTFLLGRSILQAYNSIPSREIYDAEFMRGFIREIQYYFSAHHFADRNYALFLLDQLKELIAHIKDQVTQGKKFIFATQAPAQGNELEVYHNETLNGISATFYTTDSNKGLYIAHNILNPLHTSDSAYFEESYRVLEKQFANSSVMSVTNEKERNEYFHKIERTIDLTKQKLTLELEEIG